MPPEGLKECMPWGVMRDDRTREAWQVLRITGPTEEMGLTTLVSTRSDAVLTIQGIMCADATTLIVLCQSQQSKAWLAHIHGRGSR